MSLDLATRLVTRLGPVTVAMDGERDPDLARHLALLGCVVRPDGQPAPVVLRRAGEAPPRAGDPLVLLDDGTPRARGEQALFARGWARHPAGLIVAEAGIWTAGRLPPLSFWRRGRAPALLRTGGGADVAIARFAAAAALVRDADRVVVGGAEADAGAAIVAAQTRARAVEPIAAGALVAALAAVPARSIDTLILIGVAADPALLDAAERALKADGRLVIDATAAALPLVEERFIVDRVAGQFDGRPLLVASADPLGAADTPYRHPAFHPGERERSVLVDFAAAYDNPHLYRTMVQLGERIGDALTLARLAECVLEEAAPTSADRGAALAVLGYRVLDLGLDGSVAAVVGLIDDYLAATAGGNAPHVLRWRLSLLFLAGRLAELAGDPAQAIARVHAASLGDWAGFSPILATKAIAAAYHEARLHLAAGARDAALACFRRGLDTALAAAAAPHATLIGPADAPVPFYLQEMAEIMDMGGQCALALHHAPLLDRDPGLFWRQVDAKRFGLFAWADQLQREHGRLHAA